MTLKQLISKKRAALAPKLAERAEKKKVIDGVRARCDAEDRDPTDDEATLVREAADRVRAIDAETEAARAEIDELEAELRADDAADALTRQVSDTTRGPAYDQVARIGAEERTYTAEKSARGEASFFADAYGAQRGNTLARQRLERNLTEAQREGELSERALSTASFGGLVVPQYLVDLAAPIIRSGRPVANAVRGLPLPAQGMTLTVPRGTTGAAVSSQATENSSLQNTDEVWADLVVPVRTLGGQQDVSRQSLERGTPGMDEVIYMDLVGAYHAEVDRQVITGSGASGQMLGIFNTAGIAAATAFGAAPGFANVNAKLAGIIAAIAGVGKAIQPRLIFAAPRRWGWLSSLLDSAGRPIIPAQASGVFNAGGINANPGGYGGDGDDRETVIVGSLQGLPLTTDANVPTAVGTNSEDLIGVMDPSHALLWEEGDRQPRELRFEQTLGNQLTVKLVIYGYAAFTAGRYPQAFGKIGGVDSTAGQGLVAPTF